MINHDVMQVIINADDLGMDARTNDMIFELMLEKRITSATVMANGSACEDAVFRYKSFPHCSFGVHLNLTSGKPLSCTYELLPILDNDGMFSGLERLIHTRKSILLIKGIYNELSMQIERLLSLGVEISHIDSHQHIHNLPCIFLIIKLLQKKYNLRRIRLSKNLYMPDDDRSILRSIKKIFFNSCVKYIYKSYTTDCFTGFDTFYMVGQLRTIKGKSAELMVHLRERECGDYAFLVHDWCSDLVFPVELVSYWQINGMR